MKILKNEGKSTLLATWPSPETNTGAQMVLEKAGRTCYQSEKNSISPETAHRFVGNVHNRTHYSVLEHGWRGYFIEGCEPWLDSIVAKWWPVSKYMYFTRRYSGMLLVSANLETWRKAWKRGMLKSVDFSGIRHDLGNFCSAIFPKVSFEDPDEYYFQATPIDTVDDLINEEERLNHIAHTTVYDNCSRGFSHELVRHRPPVFSQESSRYVSESDFEVVVPPHRDEKEEVIGLNLPGIGLIGLDQWLDFNGVAYQSLRKAGWRPEDARQILPTAINAQIVMSCNLLERRYIWFRRTDGSAHWEIRKVFCDELNTFPIPSNLKSMFEYVTGPARDGVNGFCKLAEGFDASYFCD